MKRNLILVGSGGCMRELLWQIAELNKQEANWEVLGYVDISNDTGSIVVGNKEYPYLGTDEYLLKRTELTNVAICIGDGKVRKGIAEKLKTNPHLHFPNIILSRTCLCEDVTMGQGNIISMDCRISTNVSLGDFVFLNLGASICHDGRIGNYTSLSPDVRLAGNVTIGHCCQLGMATKVIQGISIGDNVITGAGSVVVRNLSDNCLAVGVPARKK